MSRLSARDHYIDRVILKELRLRVETTDPLYFGMKKLRMRGKDLKALPAVLFTMMDLEVLDMSPARESCLQFRLPFVPPSIGKLINLCVLLVDTNELYDIPKEVCLLQSLERVSLSNNFLTSLPHGFGRLFNLRSLHIANNRFDAFPLEICDLEGLEFLDLSDNHLVTLPDDVKKMKNMKTLLLNYNKLIRLPDTICKLDLECLWLGNNRLRELPRHFGDMLRLDWGLRYTSSFLEKNPLIHPPIEVVRLGPWNVEEYFVDLEKVREGSEGTPAFEQEEIDILETAPSDDEDINGLIGDDTKDDESKLTTDDENDKELDLLKV